MKRNLEIVLKEINKNEQVQNEVKKNFENNLWWPNTVEDKDMRLIIAGLSTRVSYAMIHSYIKVIQQIEYMTFDEFVTLSKKKKTEILKPLGLINSRINYVDSMAQFIKDNPNMDRFSDDEFMKKVSKNVKGASYKVAQCALLYRRGYPNEIMPVDSGLKDVMLPCIGYPKQKAGYGHEIARKLLEKDIGQINKLNFIENNKMNITAYQFNWWAHLSLIYYKRACCNKKKLTACTIKGVKGLKLNHTCI